MWQAKQDGLVKSASDDAPRMFLARTGPAHCLEAPVRDPPAAQADSSGYARPWRRVDTSGKPWWLWFHLLSLDAPTVSVIWALLFARCYGVRLAFPEEAVLGLTVWVIYVGDRLSDGWRATDYAGLQHRHFFYAQHRTPLVCLGALAASADLWLIAANLGAAELLAGLKFAAIVGAYLLCVHASPDWIVQFLPKELVVGILFAAGTTLPVWSKNSAFSENWRFSLTLFALLCSLNCLSIECWERNSANDVAHVSELILGGKVRISEFAAGLMTFALAPFCGHTFAPSLKLLAVPVFLSALLIFCLNFFRDQLSLRALRVLVDLVLVVPALVALTIRI